MATRGLAVRRRARALADRSGARGGLGPARQPRRAQGRLLVFPAGAVPVAVWSTDEGLGGVVAHVANDRPAPLSATVRIALYREFELPVDEARVEVVLAPHETWSENVEELLGRFVDISWSYRFGPPAQDVIVLSLEGDEKRRPLAQSFRFPAGRPTRPETATQLGLQASLSGPERDGSTVTVASRRLAYGVPPARSRVRAARRRLRRRTWSPADGRAPAGRARGRRRRCRPRVRAQPDRPCQDRHLSLAERTRVAGVGARGSLVR